jgi:hypothetical protein
MIVPVGLILLIVAAAVGLLMLGWRLIRSGARSTEISLGLRAVYVLSGSMLLVGGMAVSFFVIETASKILSWGR